MRILVADKLAPFVTGRLRDGGAEVEVDPAAKDAALTARITELNPDVLIVRSTRVTRADVEAASSLSLVVRGGAGVNTIDLAACSRRGIYVANCPGKNAAAVAELTIGHLLNLDRRIADNVAALRRHRWDKKTFSAAKGLRGRTLAVFGVGQIGRETIARARAFGMHVVAWSRSLTDAAAEAMGVTRVSEPEAAVEGADAVSVHLALVEETRGRIGHSVFSAMKPGAYFVNTARAELVDHEALLAAIRAKGIRAGLDVFPDEPSGTTGDYADALVDDPNVYGTHHIGASTDEAEEAVGEEIVRIVEALRDSRPIPHCVNLATRSPATHLLVVRHADRVGVLAGVLGVLRERGINIEEMQNVVFQDGEAAVARIHVVGAVPEEALLHIRADAHIFSVSQTEV